jgi:hypothetical protein
MTENGKPRPWWAAAFAGGFGAIVGAGTLLGLNGKAAHSEAAAAPAVTASSVSPQQPDETQRWRERMEQKLDTLTEKVARIEGELKGRAER